MASKKPAETPLMRQFLDIKEQHPDAIVLFRLGDFYEMFFDDAKVAARQLDLTLTTRDKGKEDAVPMCGVPHHAARGYIAKLIELGHKVVIAEQVEDPKLAKGLVRRAVARIVTPGVFLDEESLDPKLARYVAAVVRADDGWGLAYLDATTGELRATVLSAEALSDEILRVAPRELLATAADLGGEGGLVALARRLGAACSVIDPPSVDRAVAQLGALADGHWPPEAAGTTAARPKKAAKGRAGQESAPPPPHAALVAAAAVLAYAAATQPTGALPVARLELYQASDALGLDEAAVAHLELVETMIGKRRAGSLLEILDRTATAPGARLLRRWLLFPLLDVPAIRRRQDAIEALVADRTLAAALEEALREIADLERLAGKATLGIATPRDLARLRHALSCLPGVVELILRQRARAVDFPALLDPEPLADPDLARLAARLAAVLADEPPALLKDPGVIRSGVDALVDECRRLADGGKDEILAIETRERQTSGIASLKVRYNRVFGYYIEISKSHLARVPERYQRKQTIATGERYVTAELAELERKVLGAEETLARREAELFAGLVQEVSQAAPVLSAAGAALAVLDVCSSLARVALANDYVRPEVEVDAVIDLVDARHPVIERILPAGEFVPNDCHLDPNAEQLLLITGPNMAGKSTYMRQVAQIVVLAQMGSFVPARAARVGVCDRIFTRVGAADSLSTGDSTFMVEMREAAVILSRATRRSLVVLDEIGRGTSTFDGVSIAWAVCEHLHDVIGARTLFATHYHELVALAETRPRARNFSVAVRENQGEIAFLRRLVPGGASRSYGIEVARLAGLPRTVVARARQILGRLEGGAGLGASPQLSLMAPQAPPPTEVERRLRDVDLDRTTPLEALAMLHELRALCS